MINNEILNFKNKIMDTIAKINNRKIEIFEKENFYKGKLGRLRFCVENKDKINSDYVYKWLNIKDGDILIFDSNSTDLNGVAVRIKDIYIDNAEYYENEGKWCVNFWLIYVILYHPNVDKEIDGDINVGLQNAYIRFLEYIGWKGYSIEVFKKNR